MASGYSLNWAFEYKEEVQLDPRIRLIRREITSKDIFPHGKYKKRKLPKKQFYTIQLMQKVREYINEVYCTKLEAHESLQSLDVVVHDIDGNRRHLCYVKFIENNTFRAFPGKNPDH